MSEVIITGIHGVEKDIENTFGIKASEYEKQRLKVNSIFLELMRGKISEATYINFLINGTGWNISENTIKKLIRNHLGTPIPGMKNILQKLHGKYNLILLSDYPSEWKDEILKSKIELQLFDELFFSCDFGLVKADEGCFEYVINKSQIKPAETLFIDDYPNNVKNAEQTGIKGIVFKNANDLKKDLISLNILDDIQLKEMIQEER